MTAREVQDYNYNLECCFDREPCTTGVGVIDIDIRNGHGEVSCSLPI